jgi:pimeloyl-ACP methyl ester carboxylesterase
VPIIELEDIKTYYEINGEGSPFIFIQGAFISSTMWEKQVSYFSDRFQTIIYDLRGHGKTGPTDRKKYSVELYADDLIELLDALNIEKPIICGISLGGMIGQVFATKYPERLSALILADTAATITLTRWDYIMRYLVGPKWLMLISLRMMGVHRFIRFSFWFVKFTRSKEWLGDEEIIEYEKNEMLSLDKKEYLKIFGSLYDFKLQELTLVQVPTLVLNGEHEPKSIFKHAEKIQSLVPNCEVDVIKNTGHTSNMENPEEFNQKISEFLKKNHIG